MSLQHKTNEIVVQKARNFKEKAWKYVRKNVDLCLRYKLLAHSYHGLKGSICPYVLFNILIHI